MIVDLATSQPGEVPPFDVCVAGGGVAGLTTALKLASVGRRVAVIEAGDRTRSAASQAFYQGENAGVENLPLHETRLRMLGGSSNHWGGWCKPFAPYDLARTDLTPGSAWPISTSDLAPYLDEAAGILGITEFSGEDLTVAGSDGNLQSIRMFFSAPPAALGERFVDAIATAPNLFLFLNTIVVGLEMSASANRVEAMTVRSVKGGTGFGCRARQFVLALGTVENIRMLQWWNQKHGNRVANPALLGRHYMQHLHQTLGEFVLLDAAKAPAPATQRPTIFFASTEKLLRATGLGAFRLYSSAIACDRLKDQLSGVAATLCTSVAAGGSLAITCEQAPNPNSRILLLSSVDELGIPRVRMDWAINEADKRTLKEAALEFGRYLVRAGVGRLKVSQAILDQNAPLAGWTRLGSAPGAAGHQLGGIRMSRSPDDGVTNPDCRLWSVENLYVGGSGVFRTSGHVNPTLTLTQLALRVAATLDRSLAR